MCLNRTTSGPPETLHFAENCSVTSKEKFGGPVFPPNPANRETTYGRRGRADARTAMSARKIRIDHNFSGTKNANRSIRLFAFQAEKEHK